MKTRHRWRFAVAAFVVLALAAVGWLVVRRELASTWLLFGAHPEVIEVLGQRLEDQRRLAELDPSSEEEARADFEHTRLLLQRLRIVELNRSNLLARLRWFVAVLILVAVSSTVVGVWLQRRRNRRRLAVLEAALERSLRLGEVARIDDGSADLLGRIASTVERLSVAALEERRRAEGLRHLASWQDGARLVAHEVRTPMTSLQLDLAGLSEERDGAQRAERLARCEENLRAIEEFVHRYTELARLPAPQLEDGDLPAAVHRFVRHFADAWAEVVLEVGDEPSGSAEPPGDGSLRGPAVWCRFDERALHQVLRNLCQNAVDAGAENVRMRCASHGEQAHLEVDDDGAGVPSELSNRIFEPYVSGHNSEEALGVGLAASRKILLDHGGDLTLVAANGPLGGASLRLTLPLLGEPDDAAAGVDRDRGAGRTGAERDRLLP